MTHEHSQAEMFAGTSVSGVKDMPSQHSKIMTKKCIECHTYNGKPEADTTPSEKGGHTFRLDENVCLKCHHHKPKDMLVEWNKQIAPLVAQLKDLLDKYPDKTSKTYVAIKKNYGFVTSDSGMQIQGIHNPKYAISVLQYSISALTVDSNWKTNEQGVNSK